MAWSYDDYLGSVLGLLIFNVQLEFDKQIVNEFSGLEFKML